MVAAPVVEAWRGHRDSAVAFLSAVTGRVACVGRNVGAVLAGVPVGAHGAIVGRCRRRGSWVFGGVGWLTRCNAFTGRVSGADWKVGLVRPNRQRRYHRRLRWQHDPQRRQHRRLWYRHDPFVGWRRRWRCGCALDAPAHAHDHAGCKRKRRHSSKNGHLNQPLRSPV
jgi:hypothetical protein